LKNRDLNSDSKTQARCLLTSLNEYQNNC